MSLPGTTNLSQDSVPTYLQSTVHRKRDKLESCNVRYIRRVAAPDFNDSHEIDVSIGCCSVLQCVAVCCSVLQCVAVCCSVL
jgi:hypothetical protein